ncbi:hypothetical protein DFH08DRAFT_838584 [Mycena albidolilacea]|uniref:Uncharacterized protein n=1 Tax=Mycena albidolilacea TaxID=1033008 RepID=A0AAD7F1F8_9AGAR|nr:hypothetical protein DFH08DRAFT_838584 [Mycena albidolilacea]
MSSTTIRPAASPKKRVGSANSPSGSRATSPKLSLTESPKKKKKHNPPKQAVTTTTPDTDDEYASFLRTYPQKFLQLPFPFLQIFVETNGTRLRVDRNEDYASLAQLARTVLTHLVESRVARSKILGILACISDDEEAKKALTTKLNDHRDVTPADILNYLINDTPTIVVKKLKLEQDHFVWGQVLKGQDTANELFISEELASTCPPPSKLTSDEVARQKAYHQLLTSITLFHEIVHCVSKFFFPHIITPKIGSVVSDNKGNGEAGWSFEEDYFSFRVHTIWNQTSSSRPDRMWKILNLVAVKDQVPDHRSLDQQTIGRILDSLNRAAVWRPPTSNLRRYYPSINHVRFRVGDAEPVEEKSEEEDQVPDFGLEMENVVFSTTCAPRGNPGLGLGLAPF